MTYEAEEQALAEMQLQRHKAEHVMLKLRTAAEREMLRPNARIYDWGAVRLATALMHYWDERCAQAEDALRRCKEKEKAADN